MKYSNTLLTLISFFFSLLKRLLKFIFFFFNDPPPPEIYTLPLHAAFPISVQSDARLRQQRRREQHRSARDRWRDRRPLFVPRHAAVRHDDLRRVAPAAVAGRREPVDAGVEIGRAHV